MPAEAGRRYAGLTTLVASATAAAALGWSTLIVVAQVAGPQDYTVFAVLWSFYYAVAGVLAGLQQEVTRAHAAGPSEAGGSGSGASVGTALVLGCGLSGLAVLVLAVSGVVPGAVAEISCGLLLGLVGLTGQVVCLGLLAGGARWASMAVLVVLDAGARLAAVSVAAVLDAPVWVLAAALGAASWVWLPFGVVLWNASARVRSGHGGPQGLEDHSRVGELLMRPLVLMASSGLTSLLVAGLPWLFAISRRGDLGTADAGLLASLVLFRSPLLALANGVRPVILKGFLVRPHDIPRVMSRVWLGYAATGALLATLAWSWGPEVLSGVFGSEFVIAPSVAAGLTVSSTLLVMATHGGVALVALDRHRRLLGAWILGFISTVAVLVVPLPGEPRLLLASLVGPGVVLGWLARSLLQSRPRENADSRSCLE